METEVILTAIQEAADTIATPNWADIVSVGLSLLAVVVAGFVAWKQYGITKKQNEIAEKQVGIAGIQNRIALFEKKYEVYCELFKIISVGYQLNYSEPHSCFSLLREVEVIYDVKFADGKDVNDRMSGILSKIKRSEYIIRQSMFLFNCIIDEEDVSKLINALMTCMIFILKSGKNEVCAKDDEVNEFIKVSKEFSSKYLDDIETELTLK